MKVSLVMKNIYKFLLITLILYNVVSFTGGIYPYDENILNKEFYPDNSVSKYTIISVILLFITIFTIYSLYFTFGKSGLDVDVLLSRV